jgi:type IV secretion system protein VirB9
MRRLLALVALAAGPAQAADPRLVTRAYDPGAVVRIEARPGVQATIGFGEKEAIENVAVGDAEKWQITPNKRADLLFVRPLATAARTNMTVVTNRRTYFFDLVARPGARPLYSLRFTYPPEPKPAPAPALEEAERQALAAPVAQAPADPAALDFGWRHKGDTALIPAQVYDDGEATYLVWGAKQPVPAILVLNDKGEEGAVNATVRGNATVLGEVPRRIVLRSGSRMALLEKTAPVATPTPVPTR